MRPGDQDDKQLKAALREWKVDSPLPFQFQERVWRRLAAAEPPAPPFWSWLCVWLESVFRHPALAASYLGVLLAMGIMAGLLQAKETKAAANAEWRARYVQSVDPYLMPRN